MKVRVSLFGIFAFLLPILLSAQNEPIYWNVKAVKQGGDLLDVKAIDKTGNTYDIKAIETQSSTQVMDVKAFVGDDILPVKLLISDDWYVPVGAIKSDGEILDIKAISGNNQLEVKGTSRSGNLIHISAIGASDNFMRLVAVSSEGKFRDIKGVKFMDENIETEVEGIKILAHIKGLPQVKFEDGNAEWNIKVITPDGGQLDIKALDKDEKTFDILAMGQNGNFHILDIKARVFRNKHPVKVMVSNDKLKPLQVVGDWGKTYDVKAISPDGKMLEIKGVEQVGNIIHIKAIAEDGTYYAVKAISPDGTLYDVKGIKMNKDKIEGVVNNREFHAHLKALPPVN